MAPLLFGGAVPAKARSLPGAASPFSPNSGRWPRMLLLAGCGVGFWFALTDVSAQARKASPILVVASQLWLNPGTENPLEIKVVPADAVPPQSVIVVRGVPPGMRFPEGRLFGEGVWVLPASRLPLVKLQTPTEIPSGGMLTVALTTLEGASIAETQITIISVPAPKEKVANPSPLPASPTPSATSSTAATQYKEPSAPQVTPEIRAESLLLTEKGKESLRLGNVLIARQFFERAANKGLAEAALVLATTYDPRELHRTTAGADVVADTKLARKWYEKAIKLGSAEATARLSNIGRR